MKSERKEFLEIISLIVFYTILSIIIWKIIQPYLTKEFFSNLTSSLGFFGPILMLLLQALQVLLAPIPVQPVSIACGYLYGAFWGYIISYLGLILGSFLAFYIGKIFGRPLVRKIVSRRIMNKYDGYIQKVSVFVLTIIMFLPLFPDDEILYILGMSKTKFKKLYLPILLGKTGGASGALFGAGLASQYGFLIIVLAIIFTVLVFYYRNKIEKFIKKIIKKIKA